MKASEKAQQDKIENALLKRRKAEHKAYTTTVIADSFKRELDKKQEFIEELYQENIDLREYKAWAQRKHIADAKFLKEKLENYAQLSAASQAESAKRILLEKQLAVQIASHDSAASSQKAAHEAQIAALEGELRRASGRIETAEKAVASLTESLRIARNRHVFDELRLKDATKQTEIVRVQQASLANEQVALAQRAMSFAQDELAAVRRAARDTEGQVASLTSWKDAAAEAALQDALTTGRGGGARSRGRQGGRAVPRGHQAPARQLAGQARQAPEGAQGSVQGAGRSHEEAEQRGGTARPSAVTVTGDKAA